VHNVMLSATWAHTSGRDRGTSVLRLLRRPLRSVLALARLLYLGLGLENASKETSDLLGD
jgi:hypothetical protein